MPRTRGPARGGHRGGGLKQTIQPAFSFAQAGCVHVARILTHVHVQVVCRLRRCGRRLRCCVLRSLAAVLPAADWASALYINKSLIEWALLSATECVPTSLPTFSIVLAVVRQVDRLLLSLARQFEERSDVTVVHLPLSASIDR